MRDAGSMMNFRRRFSADHRDRDFAPALERVDLHGRLRRAAWPALCANCGSPAMSRLVVKKIFRRQPGGRYQGRGWKYVIRSARIPYCPSCIARNAEIVASERMPFLELVVRLVATPLVIPLVGGMIVARVFLPDTLTKPIGDPLHNVGLAIVAATLLATGMSAWGSWHATSFHLVPAENEITSACTWAGS